MTDKERYEHIIKMLADDSIIKTWQIEDLKKRLQEAEAHFIKD